MEADIEAAVTFKQEKDREKAAEFLRRLEEEDGYREKVEANPEAELATAGLTVPQGLLPKGRELRLPSKPEIHKLREELGALGDPFGEAARPSLGFIIYAVVVGWAGTTQASEPETEA